MSLSCWQRARRTHEQKIKRLEEYRKTKGVFGGPEVVAQLNEAISIERRNWQRAFTPRRRQWEEPHAPNRRLRSLDLIQGLVPKRDAKGRVESKKFMRGRSGKILKAITKGVVGRLNRYGKPVL